MKNESQTNISSTKATLFSNSISMEISMGPHGTLSDHALLPVGWGDWTPRVCGISINPEAGIPTLRKKKIYISYPCDLRSEQD